MENGSKASGSDSPENYKLIAHLTDVGRYSYSALCCVGLTLLFEDEENKEFCTATLEAINKHICLPSQAATSIMEMLRSSCCDDPRPFADALLEEKCLKNNGLPVVTDLLSIAVINGHYDARFRVVIKYVAWQLKVNWDHAEEVEELVAETLEAKQYEMSEEEMKEKKKKLRNTRIKRFALIGLATVGGGALIGLTGGLAAPLVAAGAASIIGGAGAAALGTTAGVAIIGSLFGVAGAGLTGYKMKKRVGAIEEFEFETLVLAGKQLHITIAISGWLTDSVPDFKTPWQHLAESKEQYTLRWESKYLIQLGKAIDYIFNTAMSMATQEALKYTILSGILAAIAWPAALISVSNVIDNPWSVGIQRATAAGKQLAEVLLAREQGNRPVTLIGYSLGSRVIFSCLEELARRKGSRGIIEDVVMLGSPVTANNKVWSKIGPVVAGRIINGYCRGDWLLKFLFRTVNIEFNRIAGLGPIKWNNRRMHNMDLSEVVSGHKDYLKQLHTIMRVIGLKTKQDVVRTIPPHKLLPNTEDCDFTSSEEEDNASSGNHGNTASSNQNGDSASKDNHGNTASSTQNGDSVSKDNHGDNASSNHHGNGASTDNHGNTEINSVENGKDNTHEEKINQTSATLNNNKEEGNLNLEDTKSKEVVTKAEHLQSEKPSSVDHVKSKEELLQREKPTNNETEVENGSDCEKIQEELQSLHLNGNTEVCSSNGTEEASGTHVDNPEKSSSSEEVFKDAVSSIPETTTEDGASPDMTSNDGASPQMTLHGGASVGDNRDTEKKKE